MEDPKNLAGDVLPTFYIDGRPYEGEGSSMTAAQLLAIAGLEPDEHELVAEGHHGRHIAPEEAVPVQNGARFRTHPRTRL